MSDAGALKTEGYGCFVQFCVLLFPAGFGLFQICELVYRYRLYVDEYHGQPFANHIGSSDFLLTYALGALACCMALLLIPCAVWERRHPEFSGRYLPGMKGRHRVFPLGIAVALCLLNLLPMAGFYIMHEKKMLVTHEEYMMHGRAARALE